MKFFKGALQHVFNPLHVYCRLCELGFKYPTARRLSTAYERLIYRRFS